MSQLSYPRLAKWPFFLGDALLLAVGAWFLYPRELEITHWYYLWSFLSVATGAILAVIPFLLEHRASVRFAESAHLVETVAQVQRLEEIAGQVGRATSQWQMVHEAATKTNAAAREVVDRISAEAKGFAESMQKANDAERQRLRLEVEKLRRAEGDWLHVVVRVMDHVYALHQAGARSGQPRLMEQLGNFQDACRDTIRRLGLVPFSPKAGDPFDPQVHHSVDAASEEDDKSLRGTVHETVATGITFQGQLLRRALVRLQAEPAASQSFSVSQLNQLRSQTSATLPPPDKASPAQTTESTSRPEDPATASTDDPSSLNLGTDTSEPAE